MIDSSYSSSKCFLLTCFVEYVLKYFKQKAINNFVASRGLMRKTLKYGNINCSLFFCEHDFKEIVQGMVTLENVENEVAWKCKDV
jgi:hypothetical protein